MTSRTLMADVVNLFEKRQRQLYVAALAITRERSSAQDVVQDALLAVAELGHQPENLEAYLFRTVRNMALHRIKQQQRFTDSVSPGEFLDLQNCSPERQVLARQVLVQLDELDASQRQVLIMKLFADLTFDEIATITETSPNTVASWYRRGLNRLKEKLYEQQD